MGSGRVALVFLDFARDEPAQGFALIVPLRLPGLDGVRGRLPQTEAPRAQDRAGTIAIPSHVRSSRALSLSLTTFLSLSGGFFPYCWADTARSARAAAVGCGGLEPSPPDLDQGDSPETANQKKQNYRSDQIQPPLDEALHPFAVTLEKPGDQEKAGPTGDRGE